LKKIFTLLLLFPLATLAQPTGYYNNALGLNGVQLRNALYNIIKNHNSLGYSNLWTQFSNTDAKPNGKVWDIYSDKPGQTPPYQYTFGTDQCGNYNQEGDCYNREHTYPQSYFNSAEPMRSDLFQVYPTDGFVNGKRSDLMYGVVTSATYTSQNGSKVGNNSYPGSPSGNAFEPIDSFKGDLARTYFYIATRYKGEDNSWSNWEMANGAELKQWAINMLLDWHHNDPVSQKEKNRNNAIYNVQNNRNPFIDYPVFADCIWGTGNCTSLSAVSVPLAQMVEIFPNPASDRLNIRWSSTGEVTAIEIYAATGRQVAHLVPGSERSSYVDVGAWAKGVYFMHIKAKETAGVQRLIVQ
jgi:endonuclease I